MAAPVICEWNRCGQRAEADGFCMEHRFGTCETPGCGKIAVGRVALSDIETGDDGRLYRRFKGMPLACAECTDLKKRAAKVAKAA